MSKYYITKADEMVGPLEMEKPNKESGLNFLEQMRYITSWEKHCAAAPKHLHRLPNKVGDIVEEGKDFEWFTCCAHCDIGCIAPNGMVAVPKEEKPKERWLKGQNLELSVNGNDMRMSQAEVWHRDYGKFPTPGDRVVVTNVREDDGWIEIRCAHPNHIRQYWPPEYFKEPSAKEKPVEESFTREDMIGFAEWAEENYIKAPYAKWRKGPNVRSTDNMTSDELLTKYLTNKSRNNEMEKS